MLSCLRFFYATILFTCICCQVRDAHGISVQFSSQGNTFGSVKLSGTPESTVFELSLQGLKPNTSYSIRLYGGECAARSASFTPVADITTDRDGGVSHRGKVLYRGQEDIGIQSIADNSHVLTLESKGFESCVLIPSLSQQ